MKHINSVRVLRTQQLALSTREFKARGALLVRCPACLLAKDDCLCGFVEPVAGDIGVCMLMYHAEYFKPSNTGQLICDVVADNYAFRWQRTETSPDLEQLLADPKWYPVVIFPHDNVAPERQLQQLPDTTHREGKKTLFIFLDGTWRQAKKMFIKSPYLQNLPVLQLNNPQKGDYQLRVAHHDHHLSTAEVAYHLFRENDEIEMANRLEFLFTTFRDRYQMYKR